MPSTSFTRSRRLLSLGAVAYVVRSVAVRARALRPVARDLRSPVLFLPLAPSNHRLLKMNRRMMARPLPIPVAEGVEVESRTVTVEGREPVRVVSYEHGSRQRPSAALLWIHGGGTVIGKPEQGNQICSRWAAELGILVISVDYRLAPEHPFPAGLEDCYTALAWLHSQAAQLGVDPSRIAIGGDSAGGLLSASLAQLARDRGGPSIALQLLEYPMLDDRTALRADRAAIVWTNRSNRYAWSAYLGHRVRQFETRPHAVASRRDDLTGLPPAWIGVGE